MRFSSLATASTAVWILTLVAGFSVQASASEGTTLLLAPHCTGDASSCQSFERSEGTSLRTSLLKAGDILDIDIVLTTPSPSDIWMVRSWLKYDPSLLEARDVQSLSESIKILPGEKVIDSKEGLVKIGGDAEGKLKTASTHIARVTFRVLTGREATISFHDFRDDGKGKTAVLSSKKIDSERKSGGLKPAPCFDRILGCRETVSLLSLEPTKLLVRSAEGTTSAPPVTASVTPHTAAEDDLVVEDETAEEEIDTTTLFSELQVTDIAATSREGSIYVSWAALRSPELTGYNIYYGTVSGKYLQRRTIAKSEQSTTIRELESGAHYFLAVRGVNAKNEETSFSDEVEVIVGQENPRARRNITTPLQNPITLRRGENVAGSTGLGSDVLFVVFVAATIGVGLAWRRQLLSSHS